MSQIQNMKHTGTLSKKYWEDVCEHFTFGFAAAYDSKSVVLRLLRQKTLPTLYRNAIKTIKGFQNNPHKAVKSSQLPVKITTHLVAFHAASYT